MDQDNHQFNRKVQYWQICIKKNYGESKLVFVFFSDPADHFKSSGVTEWTVKYVFPLFIYLLCYFEIKLPFSV